MLDHIQFEQELLRPDFLEVWRQKSREELESLLGPEAAKMWGFDQKNPHHCYNLYEHTLHTVEEVLKLYSGQERTTLAAAAFFHDIGKPVCAKWKDDRLVFYGHAKLSGEIAEPILRQMGYPDEKIQEICFYIRNHDDFISFVLPEESSTLSKRPVLELEQVRKYIWKISSEESFSGNEKLLQLWKNLTYLCIADASSQSEVALQNGVIIDSREHKVKKARLLQELIMQDSALL